METIDRVLVIVAHQDDELMAAGTIARFSNQGSEVTIAPMFDSDISRWGETLGESSVRHKEFLTASEALGAKPTNVLCPGRENEFNWGQKETKLFDGLIYNFAPQLIITNRTTDTNQSHAKVSQVVKTSCRKNNISIWEMDNPIPGGWATESSVSNLLVNTTDYFNYKTKAFKAYGSQLKRYPGMYEASVARDKYYGWMLAAEDNSIVFAEGFRIHKQCWI